MTWSRLRPGKVDESKRTRRHSILDAIPQQADDAGQKPNLRKPEPQPDRGSASPLRQSIVQSSEQAVDPLSNNLPSSINLEPPPRQRFSFLAKRHVSDPQLSRTARDQACAVSPPLPIAPSIKVDAIDSSSQQVPLSPPSNHESLLEPSQKLKPQCSRKSLQERRHNVGQATNDSSRANSRARESRITFDEPEKGRGVNSPPAYGDEINSTLALPVSRLSESSKSDGSLGEHVYAATTTQTVSTTTTFFRLPGRKKNKGPLFPLPVRIPPSESSFHTGASPSASAAVTPSEEYCRSSPARKQPLRCSESTEAPFPLPSPGHLDASMRRDSTNSAPSGPLPFGKRSQSKQSLQQHADDDPTSTPTLPQSGRTSTSTGRASLGGLFNMARLRHNSEPHQPRYSGSHPPLPGTPISVGSKSHSFTISREPILVPDREDGDTPAKYLIRLEEAVSRGAVATVLSLSNDDFMKNVLRSYLRGFKFFGDPLDMCIRKFLMVAELPKETQQIDRVVQAFANRYHECNPGVYATPDEAYFVAFSLLILHTDVFNKNNKNKMQKPDYTKNARGQGVADEILECFYDNISYTPFIHVEDDLDLNSERAATTKRKNLFTKQSTDAAGRPSREPVDPYTLILDNRLESLRPSLKDVMDFDDHYTYQGTGPPCNFGQLHISFFRYGVLQILSSRSRPDAFTTPETVANPADAHPGLVDIKVTKVGILWRKDTKKKKTRSPWQEWGAILTGAQLYFFRNSGWIKTLMHQHDSHSRYTSRGLPVVFKPPLEQFKPDVLMSTQDAVALQDTSYRKHKNAFTFVRHGGLEEIFLADNETELNDWLAKLNYASAFRTTGVRMRGWNGQNPEISAKQDINRVDTDKTGHSHESSVSELVSPQAPLDSPLVQQIQIARRQIMTQKINEANERLKELNNLLDVHLRNARHLQILAPVQNRTRERIILAAGSMSAKIKWTRVDIWRIKCYHDILIKDLEDDISSGGSLQFAEGLSTLPPKDTTPVRLRSRQHEQSEDMGLISRVGSGGEGDTRPATQPSPAQPFSMDEVFEMLQTTPITNGHKAKGSWELPPLSFQPSKALPNSDSTREPALATLTTSGARESSHSVNEGLKASDAGDIGTPLTTPLVHDANHEQEVLRDAGMVEPESPPPTIRKRPETPTPSQDGDSAKFKSPEAEIGEGRTKVRRSLQRTLRDSTHTPSHHRSRKGKESSSSAGLVDVISAKADSEGLARSPGSFTVHGKKASVINLGSEWQTISRDERLKGRKDRQDDGSRLLLPSVVLDQDLSTRSFSNQSQRPVSAVSISTTTTSTTPFQEASEGPLLDTGSEADSRQVPELVDL
ncbi:uncharacterized protein KY384_003223 [Bacidia gigantensis]|uniref:uncharacterized protein n=1 Tax=Bacidia gigantensis TaxID=2732470 RepID=UPI001D038996|nr:uncharacterized protein KY384_003223 [Bacidia gigantensis]KAG8531593.1 hypothetical protein KY384_003223 [Bacidia gigantensis]